MSTNKLLSGWFQDVLSVAMVLPVFDIERGDENYDWILDLGPEGADELLVRPDGYRIEAVDGFDDDPMVVVRRPDGAACGFYFGFQAGSTKMTGAGGSGATRFWRTPITSRK